MLLELSVKNLGVIDELTIEIPRGMIALTGETGAGKTLLVDAINLLVGSRADPGLVRPNSAEATVDGRFELDGTEYILTRVVAAEGRSKAYIDGRPATVTALAEMGSKLVDLHGQHTHQSLLGVEAQRHALDVFGKVDLGDLRHCQSYLAEINAQLAGLGGDDRARARELDLVRYQVKELDEAELDDPDEDEALIRSADFLANALVHKDTANQVSELLAGEAGARDQLAKALKLLEASEPFIELTKRAADLVAETEDVAVSVRDVGEGIEPDPQELERIQQRRRMLAELRRKYGDDLASVIAERETLRARLKELEEHDVLAASLDKNLAQATEQLFAAQIVVKEKRSDAAPVLASAIEEKLPALAMEKAKVGIEVEGDAGSEVSFKLSANPGSPMQPLAKVASGGELARAMLALRSVLSEAPPVLVFDEVDAGIGGQAGFSVGKSLSQLGDRHQVLVVTHLPQVAAFADAHLAVVKRQDDDATVSEVKRLDADAQIVELARMLSGQPDSDAAQAHARELVAEASKSKL